jgi:hypothetical protein
MHLSRRTFIIGAGALAGVTVLRASGALASYHSDPSTYSSDEILDAGHRFFGSISKGMAHALEYLFQSRGRPNGYIVGEEGSGAFMAGLRYGEGTLHTKIAGANKIYWQGPSLGWDVGADGARTMMLVYNMQSVDQVYRRLPGINGSAYLVAGAGVSLYGSSGALVAPIRTGLGARVGVNLGYLKFTQRPTWNPF